MDNQFMLSDLIRTSEAILLFPVIVLVPGYVLGWLLDILGFRRRTLSTRLALAVPVSIGICPIVTYLLWRFVPPALWLFYGVCAIAFVVLMFRERHELLSRTAFSVLFKRGFVYFVIVAGWGALATLALVDLQIHHRLYFPSVTYDYALRSAITSAIGRTGVPPHNPQFFAGRFYPLRYHYFWFLHCSAVQTIAGSSVSPRQAMLAGTVWCGIGLIVLVPLYLRFFQCDGKVDIDRRALIGIALLGVTGLDIAPVLFFEWTSHRFMESIEWWNDTVMAWVHAVMWVPHNVAGLIACLMGFLLVWYATALPGWRARIVSTAMAGVMFASAAGLAIYVTLVFAVFLLTWTTIALFTNRRRQAGLICFSGSIALILALPYIFELLGQSSSAIGSGSVTESGSLLHFAVRPFMLVDGMLGLTGGWRANLANLLLLPLNYGFELGFFLIVGLAQCMAMWRKRHSLTDCQLCGFTMAAVSFAICSLVRSSVIQNNDLGWRGILVAQFVLLIWGAEWLSYRPSHAKDVAPDRGFGAALGGNRRALILATLVLGTAGTVYEVVKVRFFSLASDMGATGTVATGTIGWLSPDRELGARTYALRQLYEALKERTPAAAVFQHNPNTFPQDNFHGMYADRQLAAEGMSCGVVFGGDAAQCRDRIGDIDALFEKPGAFDAAQIDETCHRLSIDVLVVKDTDPVWKDRESWVWKRKPMLENHYGRAFDCGGSSRAARSSGQSLTSANNRVLTISKLVCSPLLGYFVGAKNPYGCPGTGNQY